MTEQVLQVVTESLGGLPLARRAIAGDHTAWYVTRPGGREAWHERVTATRRDGAWYESLGPAFGDRPMARERLARCAAASGVVVTTGQQPGLFGGPIYTLSKALSALEFANALEQATGVPVAPVFWAATDDADFAEAASVWLRIAGGAERVSQDQVPTEGIPLAEVPLEGLDGALAALAEACGSAPDAGAYAAVRGAYTPGATVGSAYLTLLRAVLEPLGIAVLDASHPAVQATSRVTLHAALSTAAEVNAALAARERELVAAGYTPQVGSMPDLSLVFGRAEGRKVRVPVSEASGVAVRDGVWSPNVLLRPVVERVILPTVAYLAGPGEVAYFAQVSAVAGALQLPSPLVLPRWSGTVLEPGVRDVLERRGISWRSLETLHGAERDLAVAHTDPRILGTLKAWRAAIATHGAALQSALEGQAQVMDPRVVDGTVRGMQWRADRLERRILAGAKRREAAAMAELAMVRGALFPGGKRQERALSFVPLLAHYGDAVTDAMRRGAARHAEALLRGEAPPVDP